jgi:hypothetical protein
MNEHKKGVRAPKTAIKTRNPVAHAHQTVGTGSGVHRDKKREMKQGDTKHKARDYAESLEQKLSNRLKENRDVIDSEKIPGRIMPAEAMSGPRDIDNVDLKDFDPADRGDTEGSFVKNQIHTMVRVLVHLEKAISDDEDLPEWVQMKLSQAQSMIVGLMDFMISDKEIEVEKQTGQGIAESINKETTADVISAALTKQGVTYSRANEERIIFMIGDEMKKMGMSPKTIRYLMSYDQDFIPDVLAGLARNVAESSYTTEKQILTRIRQIMHDRKLSGTDSNAGELHRLKQQLKDMRGRQGMAEAWSQKYKNSINCSHPKGFSQRAHCAGKKKHNEDMSMEMTCPDCGMCQTHGNLNEIKKGQKDSNGYTKCWPGKHAEGTKKSKVTGKPVRNCVPNESQQRDLSELSGAYKAGYREPARQSMAQDAAAAKLARIAGDDAKAKEFDRRVSKRGQGLSRASRVDPASKKELAYEDYLNDQLKKLLRNS